MTQSTFLSQPTITRLPVLLSEVENGQLLVPKFQRPFVWEDEQRLLLLDSIRKGLPIGSLLVWRTLQHKMESYREIGPFAAAAPPEHGPRSYLLDGHQRVSTLFGALHVAAPLRRHRTKLVQARFAFDDQEGDGAEASEDDEQVRWPIYFDLIAENFRLLPRSSQRVPALWLSTAALFSGSKLYAAVRQLRDDGHMEYALRAEKLADQFKDYLIPVVPIHTEDVQTVLESFHRVNSQGTKMSELLMIRALSWSPEYDLLDILQRLIARYLQPVGWGTLDPQDLLDAMKVVHRLSIYRTDSEQIAKLASHQKTMVRFQRSIESAIKFLIEVCGVAGPKMLPFKYQLACLAAAADEAGGDLPQKSEIQSQLAQWFWRTTYQEYFRGIVDRPILDAAEHVRSTVRGENRHSAGSVSVPPLPLHFRLRSSRSLAVILLLLRQYNSVPPRTMPQDFVRRLATGDHTAVQRLIRRTAESNDIPGLNGPENRWLLPADDEEEFQQIVRSGDALPSSFQRRHFLQGGSASALVGKDNRTLLRLRRAALIKAEQAFLEQHGLRYEKPRKASR